VEDGVGVEGGRRLARFVFVFVVVVVVVDPGQVWVRLSKESGGA
jgi:hypothetical protein